MKRKKQKITENNFQITTSVIVLPLLFVLVMWLVFWIDLKYHSDFAQFGIYPRTIFGLVGIFCCPFLHGNLEHLYNNTIPILVLMAALRLFYRNHSIAIIVLGIILSGLLTWVFARSTFHIGASGLIYVLASFIFFKGLQTRYYRLVALSFLIVLLYGGMVWYIFPNVEQGISWESHLAGLFVGFVFIKFFEVPKYQKQLKYDWQQPNFDASQDKFMQRFDENGNFVNLPPSEIEELKIEEPAILYRYEIVSKKLNY